MNVYRLSPADADSFQALRLAGLREAPSAFGSSYEEEVEFSRTTIESRLVGKTDRGVFGAYDGPKLVGVVGLGREDLAKLQHKATIWGMYVAPEARGNGVGRALLMEAVSVARSIPDIRQVNLCVNACNEPAIHLYESVGFRVFGREPGAMLINGELQDEIHMCLYLRGGVKVGG